MGVTLLGTGCPQVDTERYGPASLVRHEDFTFLVDCGSGVTQQGSRVPCTISVGLWIVYRCSTRRRSGLPVG